MEEKQTSINNLRINYKIIGNGDLPIILLHGWGVDSDRYIETVEQLILQTTNLELSTKILVPDLPGFGKSDNPPTAWGVDDYVNIVDQFATEIAHGKMILIGHSFGGRISIKFAAKYPERLQKLILTGSAGIKHPLTIKQNILFYSAKTGGAIFSWPIVSLLKKPFEKAWHRAVGHKDYYRIEGVMKETFKKIIAEDLTEYLDKIQNPTLLAWGRNDRSTPITDAEIMKEKIKNSELIIVENAKHSLPYKNPEEFSKIVTDFIKK